MTTALVFLGAYFTACILALVRHPIYGTLAYIGVFFVHPPTRWWSFAVPDLRWSLLAAAFTVAGIVIHRKELHRSRLIDNGIIVGIALFIVWLAIQSLWALDQTMHTELINYYVKYLIAIGLIYKSVDTEDHLKLFLWVHFLGCVYFGVTATFNYDGGRFEELGGPGFSDANFAGIQAVAGILAAAALVLSGSVKERIAAACLVPFVVNGLITTISRSSFLAMLVGGLVFVWFCPRKYRLAAMTVGAIGVMGFLSLTHGQYWDRINTILFAGEEVQGVETGHGRLVVWNAQAEMFAEHPMGCGHRCTATLSPGYLDDRYLTGPQEARARSSHNTYLTLLVEQGVIGGLSALFFVAWFVRTTAALKKRLLGRQDMYALVLPSTAAILAAILVADVFVDYLKLELRMWYIAVLLVLVRFSKELPVQEPSPAREPANVRHRVRPSSGRGRIRQDTR